MKALTELDAYWRRVYDVTDMRNMFSGASSLESLNLSNWDIEPDTIVKLEPQTECT